MKQYTNILIFILLFFAPFSFAAVEPWAFSMLQLGIITAFILISVKHRFVLTTLLKPVLFGLFFLAFYSFIQAIWPVTINSNVPVFHPITIMRLYTLEHVSLFLTWLALVFIVSQLNSSEDTLRKYLRAIALCGLSIMLCMLIFPNGQYIKLLTGLAYKGIGPFFNRNHAAVFMGMSAIVSAYIAISEICVYKNCVQHLNKKRFITEQIFIWSAFAGLLISIAATRSRGGNAATLAGLLIFAFLSSLILPNTQKKRLISASCAGMLAILSAYFIVANSDKINHFANRERPEHTRTQLCTAVPKILHDYPIWGIGIGAGPEVIPAYTEKLHERVERFHNDWFEIMVGAGILGTLILAGTILCFAMRIFKLTKKLEKKDKLTVAAIISAMSVMLLGSFVDFHFFVPANAYLFFLLLGLLCSPVLGSPAKIIKPNDLSKIFTMALLLLACILPFRKAIAWRCYQLGKDLKNESRLEYYNKGLKAYPSPKYAVQTGREYLKLGRKTNNALQASEYIEKSKLIDKTFLETYPKDPDLRLLQMEYKK